jgi:hypothetical protein
MRRVAAAGVVAVIAAFAAAAPADASRLKNPSSALVLAAPSVSCAPAPVVNLSWTDSAATTSSNFRVMSLPPGGRTKDWKAGVWLGNVRSATFAAAPGSTWQLAIENASSSSNVRSVTVTCPTADTTPPSRANGVVVSAVWCWHIKVGL